MVKNTKEMRKIILFKVNFQKSTEKHDKNSEKTLGLRANSITKCHNFDIIYNNFSQKNYT